MFGEEKLQNSAVQNNNAKQKKKKHCMAAIGFFCYISPLVYFLHNKIASE